MSTPHQHADLDALADALAAEDDGTPLPAELTGCGVCSAALDELRTALGAVAHDLAGLPAVPAVPASLATAPGRASGATTVLPAANVTALDERRSPRWLVPAGGLAAAAVLVVGGGLLLTHGSTDSSTAARSSAPEAAMAVSHTGASYTKATLPTAVPGLLKGRKESVADAAKAPASGSSQGGTTGGSGVTSQPVDALAKLRTTSGLASCLAGLSGPGETSLPLAVDYASFEGKPALVVVLPSSRTSKLDVFVVGASCNQTEQDVLYYLHADRPQG